MIKKKKDKEIKIFAILVSVLFALFCWGEISGFKLFKPEGGTTWKASGPHPSAHHK